MVSRTGEANVLITRADSYREIYDGFRWRVPERFNMAVACCDRWAAAPDRVALIHERPDGSMRRYSFRDMQRVSLRTESIKAFLVLADGHAPTPALEGEIRDFVRARLARHEYPREIEFVESLPTTTTGKIMRRELRESERRRREGATPSTSRPEGLPRP